MLKIYHVRGTRSVRPIWLCHELGLPVSGREGDEDARDETAGNTEAQVAIGETSSNGRDKKKPGVSDAVAPGTFAQLVAKANKNLKFDAWAQHPYPVPVNQKPTQKVKWPNVALTSLPQFETSLDKWFGLNGNWFLLVGGVLLIFTLQQNPEGVAGDIYRRTHKPPVVLPISRRAMPDRPVAPMTIRSRLVSAAIDRMVGWMSAWSALARSICAVRPWHARYAAKVAAEVRAIAASREVRETLAALEREGFAGIALKWPNDVVVGERKLAGILAEADGAGAVVVGMGCNVMTHPHPNLPLEGEGAFHRA